MAKKETKKERAERMKQLRRLAGSASKLLNLADQIDRDALNKELKDAPRAAEFLGVAQSPGKDPMVLLEEILRDRFPHGHPAFLQNAIDDMRVHSLKNKSYAGGGDPLGNFKRGATIMSLYPSFPVDTPVGTLMMYVLKHFDRIMWGLSRHDNPKDLDESFCDLTVYSNIARCIAYDVNQS